MCDQLVTGWAGDAENWGALNARADTHSHEEGEREGGRDHSFLYSSLKKDEWLSMERPLTDMKNHFLKIKFLSQYATAMVLLLDRAKHTNKLIP